jgi:hypothetical protein
LWTRGNPELASGRLVADSAHPDSADASSLAETANPKDAATETTWISFSSEGVLGYISHVS